MKARQKKTIREELAGKGTPPGFVRGATMPATVGPALGMSTPASALASFGVDLGSSDLHAITMASRDVPVESDAFKWQPLPQRKLRSRRTRKGKYSNVPPVRSKGTKATAGKKPSGKKPKGRATRRRSKTSNKRDDKLIELLGNLSIDPDEQARIDTAALTGFMAGRKLASKKR